MPTKYTIEPPSADQSAAPTTSQYTIEPPAETDKPTPSIWQRMKNNFNSNTSGPKPGETGVPYLLDRVGKGGGDFLRSIKHPINTFAQMVSPEGIAESSPFSLLAPKDSPVGRAVTAIKANRPTWAQALHNAPGDIAEQFGNLGAGAIVGEALGPVAEAGTKSVAKVLSVPKGIIRNIAEGATETSPRHVAKMAAEASEKNAAEAATHKTEIHDAHYGTVEREDVHAHDVRTAREEAQTGQAKLDKAHDEAVQRALQDTREKEDLYKADLAKAKTEGEAQYQKKLAEVQEKRAKAEQGRRQEMRKYIEDRNQIINKRKEAEAKFKAEREKQAQITPAKEKLTKEVGNLQAGIETAREKALGEGNSKYNTVNAALNPLEADAEAVASAVDKAQETLKGKERVVAKAGDAKGELVGKDPLLESIGDRLKNESHPLTYEDLQGYYSELGNKISSGSLPGDVYHAYDQMHEAIGNEMQGIADSQGMGQQLTAARAYWKRMKQAFGKPYSATDAASKALGKAAPDVAAEAEQANRIRLLGSFDERLPGQFQVVENASKGVEAVPNPEPVRTTVAKVKPPSIPAKKPILPKVADIPNPERPPDPATVIPPPERTPIPEPPPKVEPKLPAPPDRVEHPDRPQERILSPSTLSEMKKTQLDAAAAKMQQPNRLASTFLGFDLNRNLIDAGAHALSGNWSSAASDLLKATRDIAIRVSYGVETDAFADALKDGRIRDKLGAVTERDVEAIRRLPLDQQKALAQNFFPLVEAAKKANVKVSPPLAAFVGAAAATKGTGANSQNDDQSQPKGVAAALTPPASAQ